VVKKGGEERSEIGTNKHRSGNRAHPMSHTQPKQRTAKAERDRRNRPYDSKNKKKKNCTPKDGICQIRRRQPQKKTGVRTMPQRHTVEMVKHTEKLKLVNVRKDQKKQSGIAK